jgi:NAD(P)-dependent dehydrogenase (short-subunit alcohol dehydrogenase family)
LDKNYKLPHLTATLENLKLGDNVKIKEKVAVITGAASGIGKATALLFAKEGAEVVVVDIDEEKGEETVKKIKEKGGNAFFVEADVSKAADAKKIADEAVKKHGKIDVLFNNAGVFAIGSVIDTNEKSWDRVINVNLKGTYLCSKYAIPKMIQQGEGVIINMGSCDGIDAVANSAAYCAAKAAIVHLTKEMALDFAHSNIRVNCICPGPILTKPALKMPKSQLSLFNRPGKPEEIANVALFLASDAASFITGSAILVDGGFIAGRSVEFYGSK